MPEGDEEEETQKKSARRTMARKTTQERRKTHFRGVCFPLPGLAMGPRREEERMRRSENGVRGRGRGRRGGRRGGEAAASGEEKMVGGQPLVSCSFSFISCSGCFDDPPFPLSPRSGIITVSGRRGLSGRCGEQVVSGSSTRTAARERNFRRRNNGGLESNFTKKNAREDLVQRCERRFLPFPKSVG